MYSLKTFPCSVNSLPFYPSNSTKRDVDSTFGYGQVPYIESLLQWQSKIPYYNKRLFGDYITLQFKTQKNSSITSTHPSTFTYTKLATLNICKSKIDIFDKNKNYPIPGDVISSATPILNASGTIYPDTYNQITGSKFWGIQNAPYDIYTDPLNGNQTPLCSYMWQFKLSDILNIATDSGIYFLKFDNHDAAGNVETFYSEPILVYGQKAEKTFPTTLNFESANGINKNDILVDGWFNHVNEQVVFTNRVEGDILDYEQKGIYYGYLQQNWLPENTYIKSWKTWGLNIGSNSCVGIPIMNFETISKIMEMDFVLINNQYYNYDTISGGSNSPTSAWKMDKKRVVGLFSGKLPIRFKFENQFYIGSPITMLRIFDSTGDPTFS